MQPGAVGVDEVEGVATLEDHATAVRGEARVLGRRKRELRPGELSAPFVSQRVAPAFETGDEPAPIAADRGGARGKQAMEPRAVAVDDVGAGGRRARRAERGED